MNQDTIIQYKHGFKKGLPIGLGYLPVSFSFGFMAVNGGLPIWLAVLISMTNLTSSGQLAGTNLIICGGSLIEITLNTLIINIRYMLMSLSLSQKMKKGTSLLNRFLFSFGITDETFAIASVEERVITSAYMYGLITCPYFGWALGTLIGASTSSILSTGMKGAMGIALYAMFIAIVIPPSKKSRPVLFVVLLSITITCLLKYLPLFHFISYGFCVIIATLIASVTGALLFPVSESQINDKGEDNND